MESDLICFRRLAGYINDVIRAGKSDELQHVKSEILKSEKALRAVALREDAGAGGAGSTSNKNSNQLKQMIDAGLLTISAQAGDVLLKKQLAEDLKKLKTACFWGPKELTMPRKDVGVLIRLVKERIIKIQHKDQVYYNIEFDLRRAVARAAQIGIKVF